MKVYKGLDLVLNTKVYKGFRLGRDLINCNTFHIDFLKSKGHFLIVRDNYKN